MFVSQIVSDAGAQPSRRFDAAFGLPREADRGPGLRARVAAGWRRLVEGRPAPQQVACADCAA